MRHTALSTALALTLVFVATPAQASTIGVHLLSATYSVTLTVGGHPEYPFETITSTDSAPVSESLSRVYIPADLENGLFGSAEAIATAGPLEVFAVASGSPIGQLFAQAEATSEWMFSPVQDGVADIDILAFNGAVTVLQTARMFDLTANAQVWQFVAENGIDETVPTLLRADHVYAMHLTTRATARGDFVSSTLRVSGIQAVPDNVDSFMCLCIGLLVALMGKWKLGT